MAQLDGDAFPVFDVDGVATLAHHRGETTLPGAPPGLANGSTVLLFHDAGGNGNCFRELMDCLEANHSPVSFDQPGHGRSGELDSLTSIEAMAVHAEELVKNWEGGHLILVGEGMGAAVAIEVANRAKVNVAGMYLGREIEGGTALALLLIDAAIDEVTIDQIRKIENVLTAKAIRI